MKKYEIMFIVRPTLSEEEVQGVVERYTKIITDNKAKILDTKKMGQLELAYEINDFKSGYYFVFDIEADDDAAIKEFDRVSLISSDVIRHLITKIDHV